MCDERRICYQIYPRLFTASRLLSLFEAEVKRPAECCVGGEEETEKLAFASVNQWPEQFARGSQKHFIKLLVFALKNVMIEVRNLLSLKL